MLCDAFRRLAFFQPLPNYQYVGFGSIWFTDFSLLHRSLNIGKMFCIEKEAQDRKRFELNQPFGGIQMMFGHSASELPKIDWTQKSIVWLDYDDPLNKSQLMDILEVSRSATTGTFLVVSVQSENAPLILSADGETKRPVENMEELKIAIGTERTPVEMGDLSLSGWALSALYRIIIVAEIRSALETANLGRSDQQKLFFKQVVAFEYADGAKMTTVGGVFVTAGDEGVFNQCGFASFEFARFGAEALRIQLPKLTPREMREIEKYLPVDSLDALAVPDLPAKDVKIFAEMYRYMPNFASFEP
jgi:hypothetical protein